MAPDSRTPTLVASRPPSPPRTKPTTRSSLRQSLNLAGKAFAEVINKDSKEAAKASKRSSRRSSSLAPQPLPSQQPASVPRASMGDISLRPPSQSGRRTATPDQKPVNSRRRVSASLFARSSSDEHGQLNQPSSAKPTPTSTSHHEQQGTPQSGVQNRSATLRPRNLNSASSALPKYRPKAGLNEPPQTKPPSPVRTGQRRRLDSSDEEKKEQHSSPISHSDKNSRPISPLPHRAALMPMNTTPPPTPPKPKIVLSSSTARMSPTRPKKIVKTAPTVTTAIPRPPSSSSSTPSGQATSTPNSARATTPKASATKEKPADPRSGQVIKSNTAPSLAPPTFSRNSPSPLSRHKPTNSTKLTPTYSSASSGRNGNMSHISESADETDSDADDVELLLAPVASPGAPTPAMPRIQAFKKRDHPKTPSRSNNLPTRENLSYLSPLPPTSDTKSTHLRPPMHNNASLATRGSILSWEQLADSSKGLGEDEFGRMITDVPAPFRAGAISPSLSSQIGIPESPCLSVIDSPSGGYGSISQVLLPDVTPSPGINHSLQQSRFNLTPEASSSAIESSTTTVLRLQLAAMENTAKERLYQVQAMEEEIHNIKQAHGHQVEEMQKQLHYVEAQGRGFEEKIQKKFQAHLQEVLAKQQAMQENHLQGTMKRFRQAAEAEHLKQVEIQRRRMQVKGCADLAATKWSAVVGACEVELDSVRSDKAMLSFMLAQIDHMIVAL